MGLSNHHRALVSNLGEGNWGVGSNEDNRIDSITSRSIYFPFGTDKNTAPVPGDSNAGPMSSLDLSGWGTKSNWIVQVCFTSIGTPPSAQDDVALSVHAVRPTGIKETVLEITGTYTSGSVSDDLAGKTNGHTVSYGGHENEKICGPVSYFEFEISGFTGTAPKIDCFVIGWNEGARS